MQFILVFMSTMQHKIVGKMCGVILEMSCTIQRVSTEKKVEHRFSFPELKYRVAATR